MAEIAAHLTNRQLLANVEAKLKKAQQGAKE